MSEGDSAELEQVKIEFEEEGLEEEPQEETEIPELEGEHNTESSSAETQTSESSEHIIMSKKVVIQGMEMEIEDAPQPVDIAEGPLFKKSDRSGVSAKKLNELFDKIASGCKQKYELPKMSLQGMDQLKEVYDLENTIRTTKQHYGK